ncbi:MAG TPA: hypothetical protein VIH59_35750 [Candidatus Tectomicrobia bacterium]|jgi:hypothetical protein
MAPENKPYSMTTVAAGIQGVATPSHCTTTLYDLLTAIQDLAGPADDALVVATMTHLLRSGWLTWLKPDWTAVHRARRGESDWPQGGRGLKEGGRQWGPYC